MTELRTWTREEIEAEGERLVVVAKLTPREWQVLNRLADGQQRLEIAAEMHVAESTVKTHVSRIYLKLGARTAAHAVRIAYEHKVFGGAS